MRSELDTSTTPQVIHSSATTLAPTRAVTLSGAGLATVLLGTSLPMIDFFIVNVALPTINTNLHASTSTLELVVSGYGIGYALLLVLAPTAGLLVVARALQGASAAMMLPQVLSTIQATTTGQRRSKALGFY